MTDMKKPTTRLPPALPFVRKEATCEIQASHHLRGVSRHADAHDVHAHAWRITLIWERQPFRPNDGFTQDESDLHDVWLARLRELDGQYLNDFMPVPPTAENVAFWLLAEWLRDLPQEPNHLAPDAIRITKEEAFTTEARQSQVPRWQVWRKREGCPATGSPHSNLIDYRAFLDRLDRIDVPLDSIFELQNLKIAERLKANGYHTIRDVIKLTRLELRTIPGMGARKIEILAKAMKGEQVPTPVWEIFEFSQPQ